MKITKFHTYTHQKFGFANKKQLKNMRSNLLWMLMLTILLACNSNKPENNASWKNEIIEVENQFMLMAVEKGLAEAFSFFAADSAVIKRGESIIKGKEAIFETYNKPNPNTNIRLVWKPDFIDVSSSGDMAYTYGKYTYSYTDTSGVKQEHIGIFHTVWKRQKNGEWKYVYD